MKPTAYFALAHPHDAAIYLPAVNGMYNSVFQQGIPESRSWPKGLALDDLAFWSGNSRLWNHKFALHSLGNYSVQSSPTGPMFAGPQRNFTLVGDSGGFQIGKGSLSVLIGLQAGMSGTDAVMAWGNNFNAKQWIVNMLEANVDYAITIDMPLWAMTQAGVKSPFHNCTEDQLLGMTVENLTMIEEVMDPEGPKWLNVIHGTNPANTVRWWDAVKHFRHGGWSLAGAAGWRGGLANMLSTVLRMRDEQAFDTGNDWVHVLGVSQLGWHIFLTAIQQQLRAINPQLQFSYDSATPFTSACERDEYLLLPRLGRDLSDWSMQFNTYEAYQSDADANNPRLFAVPSPVGRHFMLHHLTINGAKMATRRVDNLTHAILANHNVWTYLEAARIATGQAFIPGAPNIPATYWQAIDFIKDVFQAQNWASEIEANKGMLDQAAASKY